jgi:hypothetical protein
MRTDIPMHTHEAPATDQHTNKPKPVMRVLYYRKPVWARIR